MFLDTRETRKPLPTVKYFMDFWSDFHDINSTCAGNPWHWRIQRWANFIFRHFGADMAAFEVAGCPRISNLGRSQDSRLYFKSRHVGTKVSGLQVWPTIRCVRSSTFQRTLNQLCRTHMKACRTSFLKIRWNGSFPAIIQHKTSKSGNDEEFNHPAFLSRNHEFTGLCLFAPVSHFQVSKPTFLCIPIIHFLPISEFLVPFCSRRVKYLLLRLNITDWSRSELAGKEWWTLMGVTSEVRLSQSLWKKMRSSCATQRPYFWTNTINTEKYFKKWKSVMVRRTRDMARK